MANASYTVVSTVEEALTMANRHNGQYIFSAGGTDLQIHRRQRLLRQPHIVDLSGIAQLGHIDNSDNTLTIGSGVTLAELTRNEAVIKSYPLIQEAAASVATPVIRETATVGGNLLVRNRCTSYNQSELWRKAAGSCLRDVGGTCLVTGGKDKCFSRNVSDLATALIALNAQVTIHDLTSERRLALEELYLSDGINNHAYVSSGAILTSIVVKSPPTKWYYRKLRQRQSLDFSSLTVAAIVDENAQARVCINGVSMAPVLIQFDPASESLLAVLKHARRSCKTVDNDLLPFKYRRIMIDLYLTEFWNSITEPTESD